MSSSVHIDKKKKVILILGFDRTRGLDYTTLTAKAHYSINFLRAHRKLYLRLHYNRGNSSLFVNSTKVYQFKAKNSETKKYFLCLGNLSGNLSANKIKIQDQMGVCMIFLLIVELLTLVTLSVSIKT